MRHLLFSDLLNIRNRLGATVSRHCTPSDDVRSTAHHDPDVVARFDVTQQFEVIENHNNQ